jgi:hypothetical protein
VPGFLALFFIKSVKKLHLVEYRCDKQLNGFGLGEGGLVGCSNLAVIVCPLLPNVCYALVADF